MQLFSQAEKFQGILMLYHKRPSFLGQMIDDKNINTADDKKEEEGEELNRELWPVTKYLD